MLTRNSPPCAAANPLGLVGHLRRSQLWVLWEIPTSFSKGLRETQFFSRRPGGLPLAGAR